MYLEDIIRSKDFPGDEKVFTIISSEINRMILEDFPGLINLLYRLDINEDKLREILRNHTGDAGDLIANMIIERQLQKSRSRNLFKKNDSDEEKW